MFELMEGGGVGVSCVIKRINSRFTVLEEVDFDKAFDGSLSEIAFSLPRDHPFRELIEMIAVGINDESLIERVADVIGSDDVEMGLAVTTYTQLRHLSSYVNGDVERQWLDLFPGKGRGIGGWLKYQLRRKAIEKSYKERPSGPGVGWLRDDYENLIRLAKRALDEKCYLARTLY